MLGSPSVARQQPRQRPVSCRFCRTRKLRCSRDAPCSNCVSRGIKCDLVLPVARPSQQAITEGAAAVSPGTSNNEAMLLERMRVLEQRLHNHARNRKVPSLSGGHPLHASTPESLPDSSRALPSKVADIKADELDSNAAWLETIYTGQDNGNSHHSRSIERVSFRICPLDRMHTVDTAGRFGSRRVYFPTPSEANVLLERFIQLSNPFHLPLHVPSLRNVVRDVFDCLERGATIQPGPVSLVLAVLASGAHCSFDNGQQIEALSGNENGQQQTKIWLEDLEDIIDVAHRTVGVSIEGCQALTLAAFVVVDAEGLSLRFRSHINLAILLARRLGLHQIDAANHEFQKDPVLAEAGRCVWWLLAATDWVLSQRLTGWDRNVYNCNPRHMVVNKPLNIDDEDLVLLGPAGAKHVSWPTVKGHLLQRIRLAEISRRASDRAAIARHGIGEAAYEGVLELDFDLQQMLDELPGFYKENVATLMATYKMDSTKAIIIRQQGHLIRNHIISHRAVLHFPWFLRSHLDRRFASSWDICLLCARQTVQMQAEMEDMSSCTNNQHKFIWTLMSLFRAAVILVVEYSRSKGKTPSSSTFALGQEIVKAFGLLEKARLNSKTASRFFESLSAVMRKHQIPADSPITPATVDNTIPRNSRDSTPQQQEKHAMLGQSDAGNTQAESGPGRISPSCPSNIANTIQGGYQQPLGTPQYSVSANSTSMSNSFAFTGLDSLGLHFAPESFSYQLNEFATSLDSDPTGYAALDWNDAFAGWDGA